MLWQFSDHACTHSSWEWVDTSTRSLLCRAPIDWCAFLQIGLSLRICLCASYMYGLLFFYLFIFPASHGWDGCKTTNIKFCSPTATRRLNSPSETHSENYLFSSVSHFQAAAVVSCNRPVIGGAVLQLLLIPSDSDHWFSNSVVSWLYCLFCPRIQCRGFHLLWGCNFYYITTKSATVENSGLVK